jgi:long-chain acyl-CoA synthetase
VTAPRLHKLLEDSAQRSPDRPVVIRRGASFSYGELEVASNRLARALVAHGIAKGDRVVLVLDNTAEYLVAYYAILLAGAVVVPHYTDARPHTLAYALAHSGARAIVIERKNTRLLDGYGAGETPALALVVSVGAPEIEADGRFEIAELATLLEEGRAAETAGAEALPDACGGDLASIVYTSGTTGRPKGVMLTHGNLVANTRSIVEYLQLTADDRIGMVLPFFYVYGNSVLQTHVCVGGTIAVVGTMALPAAVLDGIQKLRCTGFSGVPSTFARLIQFSALDKYDLTSLRYLTQAGGPMTPALTEKLRAAIPGARIFVMYGQTEASARLSYLPPEELDRKMGSAGKAIPGVELFVMDKEGRELPRGGVGEIVARGDNIMTGYWQSPEETARALHPEGLRTGDLARMDEDGYLFIVGRESDLIKSGAHRIGPKEIEEIVEKLPEVAECAVTGVPDDLLGEAIAAFVVPVKDRTVTAQQVMRICHEHLPRFKMPHHVRFAESLPKTATGKLRRSELKTWFEKEPGPAVKASEE